MEYIPPARDASGRSRSPLQFRKTREAGVLAATRDFSHGQTILMLILVAVGAVGILTGLGVMEANAPPVLSFLFGSAFIGGGIAVMSFRRGLVLDHPRGVLTRWWSVFGLRHQRQTPLERLEKVALSVEKRDTYSANRYYWVYHVSLEGHLKPVRLYSSMEAQKATAFAEHAAEVFRLYCEDRT